MFLRLPKLKSDSDVSSAENPALWTARDFDTFGKVASSLDYKSPGRVKSVSSVPTIWARPLSMEMALHNEAYPIRQQMIQQWQGMLAAIALAEVRSLPLSAQLLELGELRLENSFARSLYELLPNPPTHALYSLEAKNPWQDIYIFLWEDKSVGMSSPSTIVVPSEEGEWTTLPWWNRQDRCLERPHDYLNNTEKALLWRWLENLRKELGRQTGQPRAVDMMRGLLQKFQDSLGNYPDQMLSLSDNLRFFSIPINRGLLSALNKPVKAEEKPSCVRIIPSPEKKVQGHKLYLLDVNIAEFWGESRQNVWVCEGKTLASLNIKELKGIIAPKKDISCIESQDLLLPELGFIDAEQALPGAFLPNNLDDLIFKGQSITPLLPINPLLLDYFTPEDIMRRLQFSSLNGPDGPMIRVSLDLPLSGMNNDERNPQNYCIYKDYKLKEENGLTEIPVLEVWPNLQAPGWKEYYAFYYDKDFLASNNPDDRTFQVTLPGAKEPHKFKEGQGSYQLTRMESFPSHLLCEDKNNNQLGLILLKTPPPINLSGRWKVGVDFGTSFTNVYVNRNGIVEPLPLESLHLKVTDADDETRRGVLTDFFIRENFIPLEKPLPLSSILTVKEGQNVKKKRPLYDGRIYMPEQSFQPQDDWLKTDLKWTNLDLNQLFLNHLALHITALAAKNSIEEIEWCLSYPSAFSKSDRTRYFRNWDTLAKELEAKTGIKQNCPKPDDASRFRTESVATAQYFADQEDLDLVNTTCIDMGGGTSDISIWEADGDRFQLVHQCSVQLAGSHLFTQFLEKNPGFLSDKFEVDPQDLQGLRHGNFQAKLDVLLRYRSESWLEQWDYLQDDADFQGFIRLIAMGTAGLYYYVGTILNVLYSQGKYSRNEITPVYIGGNGSRLLNWLAISGKFDRYAQVNELFSRMLSKASSFKDTKEVTQLSTRPKDEVACGLVLDRAPLGGLDINESEPIVAGEDCDINGETIGWNQYLNLQGDINSFTIPELTQLSYFLDEFNQGLIDVRADGLTAMGPFKSGEGLESGYKDRLWRDVQRELTKNLTSIRGDSEKIRIEPPFILGLKALLQVLAKEWAGK
ncbi:hypothetical protein [Crocosphaera sp.]|uniref:hypothetical protein n=1 Tax=Crocosphaera sp. TaxID=2729996 RepID=UPI002601A09A|nr:hypothetical protein [Crocosphaera sp.]MDJ0581745.1 hypothetical protein [Crocosphaera sp.]